MATIRVNILNKNNNNGIASRQNRKENDTWLPSVAQKCFCWSSRLWKAEKVIFAIIKHFIHVGSNLNLSLKNNMRRISEQTMFFRSNTGNHWNAMLREAAKQQNIQFQYDAVRFKSRANITDIYELILVIVLLIFLHRTKRKWLHLFPLRLERTQ